MKAYKIVAMVLGLALFGAAAFKLKYEYCSYMFGPEKAMVCVFFTK